MYKLITLGTLANITTGFPFKGESYSDIGIRVVRGENVTVGSLRWDTVKCWEQEFHQADKYSLNEGDIVIGMDGSKVGRNRARIKAKDLPLLLAQRVALVRSNGVSDQTFLYYLIRSNRFEEFVARVQTGSSVPHISQKQIEEYAVPLIPIDVQKAIGKILFSLDCKIEINNRINTELEAMAKTLYDYWFVQFDFPDKKGKPYKTSGGKMVWNEELKRDVPQGWDVENLNSVTSHILDHRGKTPLKLGGDWVKKGQGIIALSAKHVKDGKLIKLDEANIVGFDMYDKWMPEKLKEGDILMTSEAPLGEFYFILSDHNYCMSQRLFGIRAEHSKVLPTYLYYELSKGNGYSQIIGKQSGSTVFGIRQDELRKVKVLKPELELQELFEAKVKPMLYQIRNNEFQNKKLSELRDWLLPMLMNGQVSVSKAYEQLDEELGIAAEPEARYSKVLKISIPRSKSGFAKQVLAGKIVSLFNMDQNFTHIKFQKLQFLAEHIAEADLNLNYYFQSAGPYDNIFMHTIADSLKKAKWFEEKKYKYIPLEKQGQIDKYYDEYFMPVSGQLDKLFKLLAKSTESEAEIIATVYAVWNNRLILKEPITEALLIDDFYNWSDRKKQYTKKQITRAVDWLKKNEFEPKGFGKEIKRAKGK